MNRVLLPAASLLILCAIVSPLRADDASASVTLNVSVEKWVSVTTEGMVHIEVEALGVAAADQAARIFVESNGAWTLSGDDFELADTGVYFWLDLYATNQEYLADTPTKTLSTGELAFEGNGNVHFWVLGKLIADGSLEATVGPDQKPYKDKVNLTIMAN